MISAASQDPAGARRDEDELSRLIEDAKRGREWAWVAIYRILAPPVLGYLRALGSQEPEDLLGEVFLHVVRGLPAFDGSFADFRSWVFIVGHHRVIDERRRRTRRPILGAAIDTLDVPSDEDLAEDVLESMSTLRIRRIIDGLPMPQREVLLLRILSGLKINEIANLLGKSVGATKALQRRGLASIKRQIEREGVPL